MTEQETVPGPGAQDEVVQDSGDRAATVVVAVAADCMSATVALEPGTDGVGVDFAAVLEALTQANVLVGLDQDCIRQACALGGAQLVAAAQGVAPVDGEDARFEVLVEDHRERAPKVDERGMIDFREHGEVPLVRIGEALMRRIPATPGTPGHDVCGRTMPPRPGTDHPFNPSVLGAVPDPTDPDLLRATAQGQPVLLGRSVMVEPVVRVESVNMATGNVHYAGTVQVEGDVLPGMSVQASGDIQVLGTVEGGVLEAGGDIQVLGGVISNSRLKAGGTVAVRFIEASRAEAGHAILVEDMALHSELLADAQILVGEKSRQRGRLAGGLARAKMGVKAPQLGAAGAGLTRIEVGVDPALSARLSALQAEIEVHKQGADKLEKLVKHLQQTGDSKGLLARARPAWQEALKIWGQSLQEQSEIEQQLAAVMQARVELTVGTEGEVDLCIGRKHVLLTASLGSGSMSLQLDGSLVHTDTLARTKKLG